MECEKKRICWVTATYFLDVDLPLMCKLKEKLDIDWYVISNPKNLEDDKKLLSQQSHCNYNLEVFTEKFGRPSQFLEYRKFLKKIKSLNYDLYYFDITGSPFLYPLIYQYIGSKKSILALHNAKTPKGARLYPIAYLYTKLGIRLFHHFQVFSKNQYDYLKDKKKRADIFYAPLCLKDYGGGKSPSTKNEITNFLFFGNIVEYKRLDILIRASELLYDQGVHNFKVSICGYIRPEVWQAKYEPLIKHPELFHLDLRRIPSDKVGEYFIGSDFFVMPYQDIAQSGAMTVALNYNLPIIASRLDTFKEFIVEDKTGFFFDDHSPELLAEKMKDCILMLEEDYSGLNEALERFVQETLSTESISKSYIDYLNKLLCQN